MHWIDWTVVAIFLLSMIGVGVYFSKKAGENVDSFFVSGRSLKWYVAGASMIATSFAADTPLVGRCLGEESLECTRSGSIGRP